MNLYKEYDGVFQEWEKEGIIEEVGDSNNSVRANNLPHRPVIKDGSTTRLRPVFDASSHLRNDPSLNDCLENGLNLIELIPDILLRFRLRRLGVVSDIKGAFLQISVHASDRDSLRFLWRDGSGQEKVFRPKRVVVWGE